MRGEDVRRVLAAVDAEHAADARLRAAQAAVARVQESIAFNEERKYTMFHRDPVLLEKERRAASRELDAAHNARPSARDALTDILYALPGSDQEEADRA